MFGIMSKKLLNGILIGIAVVLMILIAFPYGMILALAFWIYTGVMVWKNKRVHHEEMEPILAEKLLKRLKALFVTSVIFFPIGIAGIIMHNVRSSLSETEESLYFLIGIIALYLFILASAGGLLIFIKGRQKPS